MPHGSDGSRSSPLKQLDPKSCRGLTPIFNFFIWNAEFQKKRKEYMKSILTKGRKK